MNAKIMILSFLSLVLLFGLAMALPTHALAQSYPGEMPMEKQAPLPVGTVITTENWQQYKDYMPLCMQWIFSGEYGFKLAPNQNVTVGPTIPKVLPKKYAADTEKYSSQVRLTELPDGGTLIANYTAGVPFPNPTDPHLGEKLMWNTWYKYAPRVELQTSTEILLIDKYHAIFSQRFHTDYMRLGHLSEPDQPIYNTTAPDLDFTEFIEVTEPEQSKYTVSLIIFFLDPSREQETWAFVPSLRRPLRLSASARCSPAVGSDLTLDDSKSGFNLHIVDFTGQVVAHKMVLAMDHLEPAWPDHNTDFLDPKAAHAWGFDTGVAWPPPPSKWELREVYVNEVKRIPSKLTGYCYGLRRAYLDAEDWSLPTEDLYDMGGKPWKYLSFPYRMHPNGYGDYFESGSSNDLAIGIDLQNQHMTVADAIHGDATDHYAEPDAYSVTRYGLPTGLLEIMQ
jgi:Protein of unknown function (DUF1329)